MDIQVLDEIISKNIEIFENIDLESNFELFESMVSKRTEYLIENNLIEISIGFHFENERYNISTRCSGWKVAYLFVKSVVFVGFGCNPITIAASGGAVCVSGLISAGIGAIELIEYICNNCGCE